MIRNILLPVTNIGQCEKAIRHAGLMAHAFSSRIHLLGLINHSIDQQPQEFADPVSWQAIKNKKQAEIDALATRFTDDNLEVDASLTDVFNADILSDYIRDHHFDLVVVCEDDQALYRLLRLILAQVGVPFCIARSEESTVHKRILLPLDISQRAECMLPLVHAIAQQTDATLLLTHVIHEPEMPRGSFSDKDDERIVAQLIDRQRQRAKHYLDELQDRLSVKSEVHLLIHRSITTALYETIAKQKANLVALCAHGYSGKPHQTFGSVTNSLMDYCPVSLMIMQDLPTYPEYRQASTAGRSSGGVRNAG